MGRPFRVIKISPFEASKAYEILLFINEWLYMRLTQSSVTVAQLHIYYGVPVLTISP